MIDGIEGLESLMERLDALDGEEIRAAVERGVKQGAEVIRRQAIANVRPDIDESGDLRRSIIVRSSREADQVAAAVVATHEEAIYKEFGTGQVGEKHHEGISPHVAVTYNARAPRTYTYSYTRTLKSGETRSYTRTYTTYGWFYPNPNPGKYHTTDKNGKPRKRTARYLFTMGQPAHPFLYPAFVAKRTEAKRLISKEVGKVVKGE